MVPTKAVTETIIIHLKEGTNLEAPGSPAAEAFVQLANAVKAQRGFISQYWGPQVETPNLFVWVILWETFEDHTAFANSEQYESFTAGFAQVFDLEKAAPLMMYCRLDPDEATAALKAGVTEVSYFTLPNGDEKSKTAVSEALAPVNDLVKNIGKAAGSTMEWVFEVKPDSATKAGEGLLCGIFGYASIDVHMRWNKKAGEGKPAEIFADLEKRNLILRPADIPGNKPESGFFHVHFHSRS